MIRALFIKSQSVDQPDISQKVYFFYKAETRHKDTRLQTGYVRFLLTKTPSVANLFARRSFWDLWWNAPVPFLHFAEALLI